MVLGMHAAMNSRFKGKFAGVAMHLTRGISLKSINAKIAELEEELQALKARKARILFADAAEQVREDDSQKKDDDESDDAFKPRIHRRMHSENHRRYRPCALV